MKIKKGDKITVLSGKDRGKQGLVKEVFPKKSSVLVEGVNVFKKHQKAQKGQPAGRVEKARPIRVDKLMIICPKCGLKTRVGFQKGKDGKSYRICKKCSELI